ncbi:sulfurtransferase [Flavobacterium agrisoli]|uniref:Sulfurtransferase n=1 Tax=Flavobacterium agrisoli TaxID=2793066 RepID=A0A934PQ56_9FLAO|nr:sulfurtransferase [Flavobacterium agrisoli]MBK0371048.1 sulfurtransferase [Flavobacterium agrisoli]
MSPLKSVQWLYENQDNPRLVILETVLDNSVNTTSNKEAKHIPNAVLFPISTDFSDTSSPLPNTIPTANQFTSEAQKLGIHSDSVIVVYDAIGVYSSPRAWWLFLSMGHQEVYVLDGGLPEWMAQGFETAARYRKPLLKGNFVAHFQPKRISTLENVVQNLTNETQLLIDARSPDRFSGETPDSRKNARSGRIPKSINLHYEKLYNGPRLKNKETLETLFSEILSDNKPLIFSCGSGITACIVALAATAAGYQDMSIYDGSWSEWGIDYRLPIEKDML